MQAIILMVSACCDFFFFFCIFFCNVGVSLVKTGGQIASQ